MRQQNSDDISSEMLRIMGSDEHKKMFGSVKLNKTAQVTDEYYDDPEKAKMRNEILTGDGAPPGVVANPVAPPTAQAIPTASVESALQSAMSGFDPGAQAAAQAVMSGNLPEGAIDKLAPFFKGKSGVEVMDALSNYVNSKAAPIAPVAALPVTAKSVIIDLVKIAEYLAAKGMEQEEALAGMLLESIALENRKAIRKQAEGMLSVLAEEEPFGSTAGDDDDDDDDDNNSNLSSTNKDDEKKGSAVDEDNEDDEEGKRDLEDEDDEEGKASNDDDEDDVEKDEGKTGSDDESVKAFQKAILEDGDIEGESSVAPY